ncbi:MAG: hypothetical protein JWN44_5145 [Myxococcales bacterium]|nr:hypothetical protein [Myxococcales bacterium]
MRSLAAAIVVLGVSALTPACSCSNNAGAIDDAGVADDGFDVDAWLYDHDGMFPDGYVTPPPGDGGIVINTDGGAVICYVTPCQGKVYQCGDCLDNDGDGLVDSMDPDCLGACQNNEQGFFGSIPGQNNAPCKADCYWDQDTGSGNDDCYWDHSCDTFEQGPPPATSPELSCTYDPNTHVGGAHVPSGQKDCDYLLHNQSAACTKFCKPLTPNGCDCFGCCENPYDKGHFVYAGSVNAAGQPTCTADPAVLGDATKCKSCTPVVGCQNTCDHCEVCFGGAPLPPDCFGDMAGQTPSTDMAGQPPPPPPQQCPAGQVACGFAGQAPCDPGFYCVTGCCQQAIP